MAEYLGFRVDFDVPFTRETRRLLLETVRAAALENRAEHLDALSWPDTGFEDFDIDRLVEQTEPGCMRSYGGDYLASDGWITFRFSPLATYSGLMTVWRMPEGTLSVTVSVCDSEMHQDDGDRRRRRRDDDPDFVDPWYPPLPDIDSDAQDGIDLLQEIEEREENYARFHATFYRDNRQLWATNRRCLRRIAERLASALPTRGIRIDPELTEEDDAGPGE